ncbi:DUF4492 domain-containing protein [Nitratifractor sp.]
MMSWLKKVYRFYRDGIASMKLGRKLWAIVAIKLFVLFVVIKWLFFPNLLQERFSSDAERSGYILDQLTPSIPDSKEQP